MHSMETMQKVHSDKVTMGKMKGEATRFKVEVNERTASTAKPRVSERLWWKSRKRLLIYKDNYYGGSHCGRRCDGEGLAHILEQDL